MLCDPGPQSHNNDHSVSLCYTHPQGDSLNLNQVSGPRLLPQKECIQPTKHSNYCLIQFLRSEWTWLYRDAAVIPVFPQIPSRFTLRIISFNTYLTLNMYFLFTKAVFKTLRCRKQAKLKMDEFINKIWKKFIKN